jgi:hypothetical protein
MYVHVSQDGITVVDASGEPVDSPPLIRTIVDDGGDVIYDAYYPSGERADLTTYSAPITGMYVHVSQDGTKTIVDATGEPVDSPPMIRTIVDDKGDVIYDAYYPSGERADLTTYSAPITDMYIHISQGKITVVDADGKPVDSPPLIRQFVVKGEVVFDAYYPGSQGGTTLEYYKPASATQTTGTN